MAVSNQTSSYCEFKAAYDDYLPTGLSSHALQNTVDIIIPEITALLCAGLSIKTLTKFKHIKQLSPSMSLLSLGAITLASSYIGVFSAKKIVSISVQKLSPKIYERLAKRLTFLDNSKTKPLFLTKASTGEKLDFFCKDFIPSEKWELQFTKEVYEKEQTIQAIDKIMQRLKSHKFCGKYEIQTGGICWGSSLFFAKYIKNNGTKDIHKLPQIFASDDIMEKRCALSAFQIDEFKKKIIETPILAISSSIQEDFFSLLLDIPSKQIHCEDLRYDRGAISTYPKTFNSESLYALLSESENQIIVLTFLEQTTPNDEGYLPAHTICLLTSKEKDQFLFFDYRFGIFSFSNNSSLAQGTSQITQFWKGKDLETAHILKIGL